MCCSGRGRTTARAWDERTRARAAIGGQLEVLKWARENGCPWSNDLSDYTLNCCTLAAIGGQLEVLRWARENGCPWNHTRANTQLRVGTWRCCGGRGSRILPARGTGVPSTRPDRVGLFQF